MELIVNKVIKTDRKDKQEYLFGENSKFLYDNNIDSSKLTVQCEGRIISFMIGDTYHVSIYVEDQERFPDSK